MAFKLRSGNKTGFKGMGSSPVKKLDDKKTQTEIKNYIKNKDKNLIKTNYLNK